MKRNAGSLVLVAVFLSLVSTAESLSLIHILSKESVTMLRHAGLGEGACQHYAG